MRTLTPNASLRRSGDGRQLLRGTVRWLSIAAISGGLFLLVWLYASGLRDPRYLDGWILAAGMSLQVSFHIAIKTSRLAPKSAARWKKVHIFVGYLLVAAFVSHSDFSLPDTAFEWLLWLGFVVVTLSGVFGSYLSWSLQVKRRIDPAVTYDSIPLRRAELARSVQTAVAEADPNASMLPLPGLPHDAWIQDLHANHLRDFFQGPRNYATHIIGSRSALQKLIDEIDSLTRYVDQQSRDKLAEIKNLVIEKDALDFAHVFLGLTRAWLFVHVPATYALLVLTVLHVLVVYAFSSGVW